jgi:hypothetical protein
METTAPGITAPVGSATVPLIEPELDWAWSLKNVAEDTRMNRKKKMLRKGGRMIGPPEIADFECGLFKDFPNFRIGSSAR